MFEIFDWIPWTAPIAFVFIGLAAMITGLTIWGHYRPPVRRKGFLGLVTDRSERVYIAIVSFALVMVISFAIVDSNTTIWAISALAMSAGILKWG
jgi:predicted small integral membrane protein|tara:strand:- start:5273 stop:5557 length:285 start_codon:yes stop_codon:yes gene_type:complete